MFVKGVYVLSGIILLILELLNHIGKLAFSSWSFKKKTFLKRIVAIIIIVFMYLSFLLYNTLFNLMFLNALKGKRRSLRGEMFYLLLSAVLVHNVNTLQN